MTPELWDKPFTNSLFLTLKSLSANSVHSPFIGYLIIALYYLAYLMITIPEPP
jgi:hypothetical protein